MQDPRHKRALHPNGVLATCILASGLAFVDGSVVNVGLPAIGAAFQGDAADLQWVINAYLLPLSALLLLGGAAGDRLGRPRLLVWGVALFALSSLACAMALDLPLLLAARGVQGISAALLLPNSLAILGATFEGEARGRAIGIWAAVGAAMGAIGPVLGGWLIDTVGWRAIFLINLPPALAAIALALRYVPKVIREPDAPPLDVLGGVLATAALGGLTWGLTIGAGAGGWTTEAITLTGTGVVLLLAFVWIEHVRGNKAMMPLAMFGSASFIGLTLLTVFLYGALGALMVVVPYVLIEAAHYSGTGAGAALLPFAIILTLASPLMGKVAARVGPHWPLSIGALVVAGGFLLLLLMDGDMSYWRAVFPGVVMIAIGMAGAVAPLTTAVLSSVDSNHTGSASGFNSAAARTAGMVATALLGGVIGARDESLITGLHATAVACAVAALAAAASAFFLIRVKVRKTG
jgi:EmrB/QacA subfamily drug resistance transporter